MDALEALADPTRRRMVEFLSVEELTAGNIAARFEQSRPAVSRHLRLLREAGVVDVRVEGTRRIYSLRRDQLVEAENWLRQRLDALDTEVRRARRGR
jgi:DNA-binding transcriptional ArsR family regulator